LRLDIKTPEHEVLKATMEALSEHNLHTDAEKVRRFLDEYRAGGLAVVAVRDTMQALEQGQVDELLISASPSDVRIEDFDTSPPDHNSPGERFSSGLTIADLLLTRARQTGARVTFIEDVALLRSVGGVGAMLRYQVN
jgi:peptide subunit release factor 1 (eRF1)